MLSLQLASMNPSNGRWFALVSPFVVRASITAMRLITKLSVTSRSETSTPMNPSALMNSDHCARLSKFLCPNSVPEATENALRNELSYLHNTSFTVDSYASLRKSL